MNNDITALAPPPASSQWGRTFIYDGLAQTDLDMAHHRLINLDTTNLPPIGIPPTINPPANQWLHAWDGVGHVWTATQPRFQDLAEQLTQDQKAHIDQVGAIRVGSWNATPLRPDRVPRLDLILPPAADLSMANHKITNLAPPTDPGDAVTLGYMDMLLQGLQPKQAVRCASTLNVGLVGLHTIDGVNDLADGDRVLLKNQSARPFENGIWIAHTGAWVRATDCDQPAEFTGAYCTVLEGAQNGGTSWVQVNTVTTVGTSPVSFVLFTTAPPTIILPGLGLEKVGDTLNVLGTPGRIAVGTAVDIDPNYAGQDSITTVGVIANGTWRGDIVDGARGGTGVQNAGRTISLCGNLSTFMPLDAPDVGVGRSLSLALTANTHLTLPTAGTVATINGVESFTNKAVVKRTLKIASNSKPAINVDALDVFQIINLNESILSMTDNLTGTPTDGQELFIWMKMASGSAPGAFTIAWGSAWMASPDLPLPLSLTTDTVFLFLWFVYNDVLAKWVLTQKVDNIA